MAMFEERPYRQKKQSIWSIWWFVGLMASGLTAWHLELIPFGTQQTAGILLEDEDFSQQDVPPGQPIVKMTNGSSLRPMSENKSAQRPEAIGLLSPPEPPGVESQSEPAFGVSVTSYRAAKNNSPIQQASYEQTIPNQAPPQAELPQPFFQSKEEFTPVRTLTYRPETEPVNARHIPAAGGSPPIQFANHQQVQSTVANRVPNPVSNPTVDLKSADNSFQLNTEARQDVLRHRELSEQYWHHPEQRTEIATELEQLAKKIYFSPGTDYLPAYEVKPGDQLRVIARQYDVPWEYLANLNRTKPEQIRPGQKLKMIKGPFDAVVDLKDYRITIHAHGYYMCSFPIGTGKDNSSPVGKFPVLNKERNPTYYGSDKTIRRDDPLNPLGEHWIDLGNGYGIHGTINPTSIGQSLSKGCIRMNNPDVAQVFDLLTTKSLVTIRQ